MTSSANESHQDYDDRRESKPSDSRPRYFNFTIEEVDHLIDFAESLKEKCDSYSDKLEDLYLEKKIIESKINIFKCIISSIVSSELENNVITISFLIMIILLAVAISQLELFQPLFISLRDFILKNINLIAPFLFISFFAGVFLYIRLYIIYISNNIRLDAKIAKTKRKLRAEEVVLERTVDLLREMIDIWANKEGWQEARKLELKLRLSRFEIGRYEISKKYEK